MPRPASPALKVVGQIKLTYIVAEGPDGMFLVDQHAAHERILFDRIQAKDDGVQPAESLLEPAMVDLSPARQHEEVLAAPIACHSAIRAGKSLSDGEMRSLLEQLEATTNPHTCPHGRPTMLHFSSFHMEREFGRR